MFQRFIADVGPDRIAGRWEASEDHGSTWRKDFDLAFECSNAACRMVQEAPRVIRPAS
jgi:hypothetical protein